MHVHVSQGVRQEHRCLHSSSVETTPRDILSISTACCMSSLYNVHAKFIIDFRWYELRGIVVRTVLEGTTAPQEVISVWFIAAFSIGPTACASVTSYVSYQHVCHNALPYLSLPLSL